MGLLSNLWFFSCGSFFCYLGPLRASVRAFWGPYTPTESASGAKYQGICFGMGTETKKSLHIGLLSNLQFFSCGWSFFVICGLYWPILRHFEVLTPLQNPPPRLNFLEYGLVRVLDQNGALWLDFWAICDVYLAGGHFSSILVTYTPPFPPHLQNSIIKLRFVVNPFASFHPEVTRRKSDFNEEFGSFLFFVFWISLKWCILEA